MITNRKYHIVAGASLLILILAVLFVPGDKDDNESHLWEQSWEIIEYYPARQDTSDSPSQEKKEEPVLRFVREPHLFESRYYVEGEAKDGNPVYFRAGSKVKNLFHDWSQPEVKGAYQSSMVDLAQKGIKDGSEKILLYRSPGGSPVIVVAGERTGADRFAVVKGDTDTKGDLLVLTGRLFQSINTELDYRERRLIDFGTGKGMKSIAIESPGNSAFSPILLEKQERNEEEKKGTYWEIDGQELKAGNGNALENLLKRMSITVFADDPGLSPDSNRKIIEESGTKKYIIDIQIDGADDARIVLYEPVQPVTSNNRTLTPVKSDDDRVVNYIDSQILDQLKTTVQRIRESEKQEKQNSAEKPDKAVESK